MTESKKVLDIRSQQRLTKAYMKLYDALVFEYQTQKMSLGRSWYNALQMMYKILDISRQNNKGLAMDYLMRLYNTHQETQAKKMMLSDKKDTVLLDISVQNTPQIEHAIVDLNRAVISCETVETLCELSAIGTTNQIPKTFDTWANNLPSDMLNDLENNSRGFEKIYKKYIYQRKSK